VGVIVGVVVKVTVGLGDGVLVGGSGVTVEEGEGSGVTVEVGDTIFFSESDSALMEAISPAPPCDAVREESSRGTPALHVCNANPPHVRMITATTMMPQMSLALII